MRISGMPGGQWASSDGISLTLALGDFRYLVKLYVCEKRYLSAKHNAHERRELYN